MAGRCDVARGLRALVRRFLSVLFSGSGSRRWLCLAVPPPFLSRAEKIKRQDQEPHSRLFIRPILFPPQASADIWAFWSLMRNQRASGVH